MKIKEVKNIDRNVYNNLIEKGIVRRKIIPGSGFEKIVIASDKDAD